MCLYNRQVQSKGHSEISAFIFVCACMICGRFLNRASDRMRKKNNKLCGNFQGKNAEKFVDYAEKVMNYAEISTVNKIDNKAFRT